MKVKDAEKKFKKIFKKYKVIVITFALFLLIGIICFVLDYFNIPYKLGFNYVFLNLDFWSIYLGNGIVIALFITTFILFDKRNLEKDKLSTYAGILLLKETYRRLDGFLEIYKKTLNIENDAEKLGLNERQKKFFETEPFKTYDKIFDCLEKGQINKERFDAYQKIKSDYEILMHLTFGLGDFKNIGKFYYDELVEILKKEKEIIDVYIKE